MPLLPLRFLSQSICLFFLLHRQQLWAAPPTAKPSPRPTLSPTVKPSSPSFNTSYWRPDSITFSAPSASVLSRGSPSILTLTISSNGPVYSNDGGHFRLVIQAEDVVGSSSCIRIGDGMMTVQAQIAQMVLFNNNTNIRPATALTDLFTVKVQKLQSSDRRKITYSFSFSETERGTSFFASHIFTGRLLTAHVNTTGCAPPRTVGSWIDPSRWSTNTVPGSGFNVSFSKDSGVVLLPPNAAVKSLTMNGGLLLAYNSTCPAGWTPNPFGLLSTKCYKLFSVLADFDTAEATCQTSNTGSLDAHLVQISDLVEQGIVRRMCRGKIGSLPYVHGCWIGLRDRDGVGKYNWIEPKTVRNNTFRDWRRFEPNNHTYSEGSTTNGELCVAMQQWQIDPLIVEQGSWNDIACKVQKPFVCQMFATTKRATLTVAATATINGGSIEGGVLNLNGASSITEMRASRTATINIAAIPSRLRSSIQNIFLQDGSALIIQSSVRTTTESFLGELSYAAAATTAATAAPDDVSMLSTVTVTRTGLWDLFSSATVNAQTEISGKVNLGTGVQIRLLQGGLLSFSQFSLPDATSNIVLSGSSKMSTYDSFELKTSHRGPVIGEYTNSYRNEVAGVLTGVYKLQVKGKGISGITGCIQYHASAQDVATELAKLQIIKDRGGVTVRKYGDGTDPSFSFGYTYRVEMDAPPTSTFAQGPYDLSVFCYGINNCHCAETKVPLVDNFGQRMCNRREGNSSRIDPAACIVPPVLIVSRISSLSYMNTSGAGSLFISDGTHRLPPVSAITISSTIRGTGIVGADVMKWFGIIVNGRGSIICTGNGWYGWDSAGALWAPEWADYRGKVSLLELAPPFHLAVEFFNINGLGSVLTASPHSNMTWASGVWNGGIIGGRSQLIITKKITVDGANKALRYAITLFVQAQATLLWNRGNISLANGARIVVEGNFTANTTGKVRQYMGMAQLLSAPDAIGRELLAQEKAVNWHGYYGSELPMELRGGAYQNPLCGEQCNRPCVLRFQGGVFTLVDRSNTVFSLGVELEGPSNMNLGGNAYAEMASGGICGDQVTVDIKFGTSYIFSGGQMAMRRYCTVKGLGELLITGGRHDLSHQIDSLITIAGGAMVWPKSNPPGDTIKFNGGLFIKNTGSLQVEPFSTKIIINSTVVFQDDSILQFPMIGVAAQAANSDSQDAPDSSPRGSLEALGGMYWNGGTIRGKADIISRNQLFIGGGLKQIRSLAKLINEGNAEWDTGDILMADGGDFLNLGAMQKKSAKGDLIASDFYQGSVTPVENGGDIFALSFHSYDLDQGYLNYQEYVRLRTQFVSQAPDGWVASQQSMKVDSPFNIV